jgi:diacylglycerol O-acyltransferase
MRKSSPKPMSPQEGIYFLIEQRKQPMHVAALQIFDPPKAARTTFVQDLYQSWRGHPHAHTPFDLRPLNLRGRWYWEKDAEFDVDYHLRHLGLPRPGRIRELLVLISQLHATLLDRNRPLWECYLVEGLADGRFGIYTKIHHGLVDGVSGIRMLTAALSVDPKEIKPPFWAQSLARSAQTGADSSPSGQRASALKPIFSALQKGAEVIPGLSSGLVDLLRADNYDGPIALPRQAPPTLFNVPISGSRRFVAQRYSLARIKRIGARTGATVNDVVLALCGSALRQYLETHDALPEKALVAMVPVSLHGETGKGGNQVGLILASLATNLVDPLARLNRIMESTAAAKARLKTMSRVEKMAHAAMTFAPMLPGGLTGATGKRPVFNVVVSNVPGPRDVLYLNRARLDEAYPVSIPADYLALNITVSSDADALAFGFTACRRSVPGLQRMVDHIDAALDELESATAPAAAKSARKSGKAGRAKTHRGVRKKK